MATLLIRNAAVLVTMDAERREIADGAVFCRDGVIEQVGHTSELPRSADRIIDVTDHVVLPGLVNTHHHLFQNLTRAVPAAQDGSLFDWLSTLYPIWARMGPEHVRYSTLIGLAELALSGCTTTSDHLYIFPNGARLDDEIHAAQEVGLRFHATRGAMSVGRSAGGLPPDELVEKETAILDDSARLIEAYNDPSRHSMLRVGLAPCSPFSVSRDLMRHAAALARRYRVGLHTHLAENEENIDDSLEKFGMRPGEYVDELGWTGPDVWHAHCVALNDAEIDLFARTGTSVAHCPCSNMRLGSGIAPVVHMLRGGVNVALGVDGSASNDSASLIGEARQAMLLQRVAAGPSAMSARRALELATRGGATALGRDDIGHLAHGMAADLVAFDLNQLPLAGSDWDPVAALLLCAPVAPKLCVVGGRPVVENGRFAPFDLSAAISRHRKLTRQLIDGQ